MRVLELEIHNVRGILDLKLMPRGKNFAVWGPNGSGKSAVVDAIDFLLTGGISRLTGEGTGGITLGKYGHHIDHDPKEATVRAVVELPGVAEAIELKRCMAHPNKLACGGKTRQQLSAIMALARRGQHVLCRRDILKYIAGDPGTRAQEIQALLNITEIERTRRALVRVRNDLRRELEAARGRVNRARGEVNATAQLRAFGADVVLQMVNENRSLLGGQPILSLHSTLLKRGINAPIVVSGEEGVNVSLVGRDMQNLRSLVLKDSQAQIAGDDQQLRSLLASIRSDPELLLVMSRRKLIELGMGLIDESGSCPLCDTPWPPGKLHEYLDKRLRDAKVAAEREKRVKEVSDAIGQSVGGAIASVEKVVTATRLVGLQHELSKLLSWLGDLRRLSSVVTAPLEAYPDARFDPDSVKRMCAPADLDRLLAQVDKILKSKYPEATPEQTAWDALTRLEVSCRSLENAETALAIAELSAKRASTLLEAFLAARDIVLAELYDDVRDRFVELYRQLHGRDEADFVATIRPRGAGLDFEVGFYGRGTHPTQALHSEGHQDSMGLCLYLALAERLSQGLLNLIILDDVIMSVDAGHRRRVCQVLAICFPERQFFITTHDKTWATQLRQEGVIQRQGLVEFYNWHIDTGPQVDYDPEMWARIESDLAKADVPAAAGRLRRGSERFFAEVCDALRGPVTYKLNARWDLGDFLPAAMGRHSRLLKQAKRTANSWDDRDCLAMLAEIQSIAGQIFARTQAEQWAVDANVHYNNWTNFSMSDFRPVVEAFQDLYALFRCSKCGGMLRVVVSGRDPTNVRCACGQVNWNLIARDRES